MSIFGAIKKAIFGDNGPLGGQFSGKPRTEGPVGGQANTAPVTPPQPQAGNGIPRQQGAQAPSPASPRPDAPAAPAAPTGMSHADVEALLADKARASGQTLDWRHSIVDLMKLLDLDSSLTARKQLAQEMGYDGPLDGSAEMNIALHKAVMRQLAENG